MQLSRCNTVDDCVEYGEQLEISHSKLFLKTPIEISENKLLISNYTSILTKYMDYINKTLVDYTISDEDMLIYKYKPKYFCLMRYGTMELWSLLLRVNNMVSIMDFTRNKIKIFDQRLITEVLNEILILEAETLEKNNEEVETKINSMSTVNY